MRERFAHVVAEVFLDIPSAGRAMMMADQATWRPRPGGFPLSW